jgi:hypothetical protein
MTGHTVRKIHIPGLKLLGRLTTPGFPPFKASQFQDLFKTELLRNQDPIDKIWTNFDEALGRRKANQRIWNDVPTAPE